MPTKASKTARNHSESRGCVCAVCFQKTADIRVISSEIESLIQSFANEDYSIKNEGLPNSICSKCRLKLVAMGKVLFSVLKRNFSNFSAEPREVKHTSKNRLQSTYPSTSLYLEPNCLACVQCVSLQGQNFHTRVKICWPSLCFQGQRFPLLKLKLSGSSASCVTATLGGVWTTSALSLQKEQTWKK
jgi:hypothetical protein